MKIESLREVKAKLSKIIKELPSEKSVVITKNGRPWAVPFSRDGRNGSRKHVTRPAKRFLAIARPRAQGRREKRLYQTRRSSGLTRVRTLIAPNRGVRSFSPVLITRMS
jgi:prevent-host-death family protein